MCGGTDFGAVVRCASSGLSPRVRGNLHQTGCRRDCPRSIPACAGEPTTVSNSSYAGRVYPRVCGGTRLRLAGCRCPCGLSPRVRGNLLAYAVRNLRNRSIPACAGEPARVCRQESAEQVYPRVCGGTHLLPFYSDAGQGLSPRVRGNLLRFQGNTIVHRSIPACAGEPGHSIRPCSIGRVYPRVCGGTIRRALLGTPHPGLSPRVRGNHTPDVGARQPDRSIPACAGEPVHQAGCCHPNRVYPRVCGGTPSPIR